MPTKYACNITLFVDADGMPIDVAAYMLRALLAELVPISYVLSVPNRILPAKVALLSLAIVKAVASAFCADPVVPAAAVWKISDPPAPVPVPREPVIVKFAPAVLDVPVTTLWTCNVWAVALAASAGPMRKVLDE
jgi:hypothetical protein